ncbi:ABC transporter permease subunit [Pseudooceanicola sediminis]|uniref:ABC transporter permease subunit n=1 Tax=Pseudooceanicola sediminis TaxID=2211117 RepID=A0A399J3U1_9RHOB|nr:ABC transporter permease subunit [Pseudooceanicola sediminis]KAA2314222.1 ABC transporter permease subunit [Puniceibacterium sp. HSS470]RII39920.1 ABC transporter permease subunit [Pseudooceanicola sediminis]|tara:strand:+ start:85868 stop:86680 length:813 start_codon:yes stop_codon:yes gene_type:complete
MRLINRKPGRAASAALVLLPFAAVALTYVIASDIRLAANPADKLLPAPSHILETAQRLFTEGDKRSGRILLWHDTLASLRRLAFGVGIASLSALVLGMAIGLLPYARRTFNSFIGVVSMVPPLAVLPILFIIFGLGETAKVALIVVGITPVMIRDLANRTLEIPHEMIVKAETLGASSLVIALRVVLPQILPRLISSIRLALGPAWLFLIAAEAIAAELGLGYRIFLVRRYLAMDVILTYVIWITLLAFVMDYALRLLSRRLFPWTGASL